MRKSTIIKDLHGMLARALPQVKYIDKDWGQLYMENPPVGWPCILIAIEQVDPRQLMGDVEKDAAVIALTIAVKRIGSGSANAPKAAKEKSLEVLDLTDDIHDVVGGFTAEGAEYTPLKPISTIKNNDIPGVECYVLRYETRYNFGT